MAFAAVDGASWSGPAEAQKQSDTAGNLDWVVSIDSTMPRASAWRRTRPRHRGLRRSTNMRGKSRVITELAAPAVG